MGSLMIALGTFGGLLAARPRSGQWMVRVKKAFGVAMILIAEYLLLQAGRRLV
jgi:thiol:disulfide interchange protein DsbD